jgi:hypothetical protein
VPGKRRDDQDGRIERELAGPAHVGHVAVELDQAGPADL